MKVRDLASLARGAAIGAGLMYVLDPVAGRRRRALIRDKAVSALYDGEEFLEGAVEDLRNRARGMAAEFTSNLRNEPVEDFALHDRIRALMGRIVSHPRAVQVNVNGGVVTLSGPIFSDEAPKLIYAVSALRGVKGLENRLESHTAPTDHPSLQGAAIVNEPVPEFLQTYWTDGPRFLACIAGCALALKGARHGGILGTAVGLAGLALMGEASTRTPKAAQPTGRQTQRTLPKIPTERDVPVQMDDTPQRVGAEAA